MATKRRKASGTRTRPAARAAREGAHGKTTRAAPKKAAKKAPKTRPRRPKTPPRSPVRQSPLETATLGGALLASTRAADLVTPIIQALLASEYWMPALTQSRAAAPVLVERLDLADSYYYIVPLQVGPNETARIRLDAKTGQFIDAGAVEKSEEKLARYLTWPDVVQRLTSAPIMLADQRIRHVREETVGRHPVLVWKPCNESRSPFTPFYQCSVADTLVYVRVDGEYFAELTFPSPGA